MNAAQPAGRHNGNADGSADRKSAADRRGADGVLHDRGREVARADLARRRVEARELVLRQADADLSVEDADRRGNRAGLAHALLRFEADGDALTRREPVRDERRLERDDRACVADLARNLDQHCFSMFTNSTSPQRANLRMCRPVS